MKQTPETSAHNPTDRQDMCSRFHIKNKKTHDTAQIVTAAHKDL